MYLYLLLIVQVGSDFTMADVFFFPIVAFGVRSKLDLTPFPFLKEYYDTLATRPSIKESFPPHWAEEPAKDFFAGV